MSDTAIDICSRALLMIGANPITSFADTDTASVVANKIYESTLRAQLTRRWGFTRTTVLLVRQTEPPIGERWDAAYTLSSDLLVIHRIEVCGRPIRYERFEHTIHCNAGVNDKVYMTYSRRVLESEFPPYFTDALELELAARFAVPITGQQELAGDYRRQARDAWGLARMSGAQEQSARRLPISRFRAARSSGSSGGCGCGCSDDDSEPAPDPDPDPDPEPGPVPQMGNVVLYTGNPAGVTVTGVGFQPNWLLIGDRSGGGYRMIDTARGLDEWMDASYFTGDPWYYGFPPSGVSAVGPDGFTISSGLMLEVEPWLAACLKEEPNAFSIKLYTGGASEQIPHSLGVVPEFIILANRDDQRNYLTYIGAVPNPETKYAFLNFNSAMAVAGAGTTWNAIAPTDTAFNVAMGIVNGNAAGNRYVAYLFASKPGLLKIGTYSGTGAAGNTITTGFRPRFIIVKRLDATGDWLLVDEKRDTIQPVETSLSIDNENAEDLMGVSITFLDTGFTVTNPNVSGGNYFYFAVT